MLIIKIQNDGTGNKEVENYKYRPHKECRHHYQTAVMRLAALPNQ